MAQLKQIEVMLMQIAGLLKKIEDHKGPIQQNLTPAVWAELDRLERSLELFQNTNEKVYEEANIDFIKLEHEVMASSAVAEEDKKVLRESKELMVHAKMLQNAYAQILQSSKKVSRKKKKAVDPLKKAMKNRRKQFKRLGGDKNWIPL